MEAYLLPPIRCFTCGKVLEKCNKQYKRYCCIRMLLSTVSK